MSALGVGKKVAADEIAWSSYVPQNDCGSNLFVVEAVSAWVASVQDCKLRA